MDSSNNMY